MDHYICWWRHGSLGSINNKIKSGVDKKEKNWKQLATNYVTENSSETQETGTAPSLSVFHQVERYEPYEFSWDCACC